MFLFKIFWVCLCIFVAACSHFFACCKLGTTHLVECWLLAALHSPPSNSATSGNCPQQLAHIFWAGVKFLMASAGQLQQQSSSSCTIWLQLTHHSSERPVAWMHYDNLIGCMGSSNWHSHQVKNGLLIVCTSNFCHRHIVHKCVFATVVIATV